MALFGNNLYDLRYTILNEAYIGKTPLLIEVEKKIHDYRSKEDLTIYNCSSTSKEILDIKKKYNIL